MRYLDVVKKAKKDLSGRGDDYKNDKVQLDVCETWMKGNQINLWSYWQGYQIKDIDKGIDILLVGQDWGDPNKDENMILKIKEIQAGKVDVQYFNSKSRTDATLAELFDFLGCDIRKPIYDRRILFSNYCLGYRRGKESGGMNKTLLSKDKELFDDLVKAVKPKIIICLGKLVYEAVIGHGVSDFSERIRKGQPFIAEYPEDKSIRVYGVAHCGALGCRNAGGFTNMAKAWKHIARDLKKLELC